MDCVLDTVRLYIKRDLEETQEGRKKRDTEILIFIRLGLVLMECIRRLIEKRLLHDLIRVNGKYQETKTKKACCTAEGIFNPWYV